MILRIGSAIVFICAPIPIFARFASFSRFSHMKLKYLKYTSTPRSMIIVAISNTFLCFSCLLISIPHYVVYDD